MQRRVVGVARHRHLRDRRLGRHAAGDQARRGGCLRDDARAGTAGELGPLGDQGAEPHRDHVEPLGRVAADLHHLALAAGAGGALGQQHQLDARQVRRQAAAARPAASRVLLAQVGRALLRLGLGVGDRGLDLREGELQLIRGQLLRASAELHALQLAQQVPQPLVPRRQRVALGRDAVTFCRDTVPLRPGHQQQRAQRRRIIGQ